MPESSRTYFIQALLFIATLITTTLAGAEMIAGRFFLDTPGLGWAEFWQGLYYSIPFLGILTAHEFGHYFTARWYKIRVSLPYYLPLWLGIGTSFGTMGAVIRIRSRLRTTREYFDVGIAGPLAGFVVALAVFVFGFTHLPPPEQVQAVHEQFLLKNPEIRLGNNLLLMGFKAVFENLYPGKVPPNNLLLHYPFLFAGYLSLLFTALNLLPVGQLDGGHILYGLIGSRNHAWASRWIYTAFVFYAGLGIVTPERAEMLGFVMTEEYLFLGMAVYLAWLCLLFARMWGYQWRRVLFWSVGVMASQYVLTYFFSGLRGYPGWMVFALILGRFLGIYHPPVQYEMPLDRRRQLLGWLSLLIFVLCFTPQPLMVE
jgi:membrane-associated protease RseP (regulator of RpoE activity)